MFIKLLFFCFCLSLCSCFDFEKSDFKDLGEGFKFGYYKGNHDEFLNIYFLDAGVIPSNFRCKRVEWNKEYIFVFCEDIELNNRNNCFVIEKSDYISNPIQLQSKGLIGPLNFDSLSKSIFYQRNHIGIREYEFSF